jgi:hypothetical protein
MRMVVAVAVTALLLSVAPGQAQAQKALDLPGMSVVAKHHGLSEATLQNTWTQHVREAVMVSQGWVWVESLKEGVDPMTLNPVACERIEELLLTGDVVHAQTTSFYTCHSGGFVQLLPNAILDKMEARYLINANAQLNR